MTSEKLVNINQAFEDAVQCRPNSVLQAEPGSTLNLKPTEIIMSGVISPSFAGAAVKNNVTGN